MDKVADHIQIILKMQQILCQMQDLHDIQCTKKQVSQENQHKVIKTENEAHIFGLIQ